MTPKFSSLSCCSYCGRVCVTAPFKQPCYAAPLPRGLRAPVTPTSSARAICRAPADTARSASPRDTTRWAATLLAGALGLATLLESVHLALPPPAAAVLNSPNARIARSADAALRRSIPAFNEAVRRVQDELEDVAYKLRIPQRKPWDLMARNVAAAAATMSDRGQVLAGVPEGQRARAEGLAGSIEEGLRRVQAAIQAKDPGQTSIRTTRTLRDVAELELLQAPGLVFQIPSQYANLPRLTGRAAVELDVEKADGARAWVTSEGGGPQARVRLTLTLDGYSAPLTAGNFAANVVDGLYRGCKLNVSYASVLAGAGLRPGAAVPLEILPAGAFEPQYRTPLEVREGELPVLPLSITGALAMAHPPADAEVDGYLAADEWFIYKFSREQAGLSGLAFDEGAFGVFGYVTQGEELLPQLEAGDVIVDARLVEGADRLQRPAQQ